MLPDEGSPFPARGSPIRAESREEEGAKLVSGKLVKGLKRELEGAIEVVDPCAGASTSHHLRLWAPGTVQGDLAAPRLGCFSKAGAEQLRFPARRMVDLAMLPASAVVPAAVESV